MCLRGKRLLVLGGTYSAGDIREYADKAGIEIIVTGAPGHPLRKIADEAYNIDNKDTEKLISLVKERNIDGIFAGSNETVIPYVLKVIKETGLPFYATPEQWEMTSNKKRFKEICRINNVPVVPEYTISPELLREDVSSVDFPVVVKPTDGSGSAGVFLYKNEEELRRYYPVASTFSRTKSVIVEKYMRGFIIVLYFTVIDGEFYVSSMADKYTEPGEWKLATLPQLHLYPSRHLDDCINKYRECLIDMMKYIGITNGVVGIQGFCENNEIVFTEMGYRLGGTAQHNYTKALYGISNLELLINFALTGKMTSYACLENPHFPMECATLALVSRGGTVASIVGLEEVNAMNEVICVENHYDIGSTIAVTNNLSQLHFRVFIKADNLTALKEAIKKVQATLHVYDSHGNSMLAEDFDINRLGLQ